VCVCVCVWIYKYIENVGLRTEYPKNQLTENIASYNSNVQC